VTVRRPAAIFHCWHFPNRIFALENYYAVDAATDGVGGVPSLWFNSAVSTTSSVFSWGNAPFRQMKVDWGLVPHYNSHSSPLSMRTVQHLGEAHLALDLVVLKPAASGFALRLESSPSLDASSWTSEPGHPVILWDDGLRQGLRFIDSAPLGQNRKKFFRLSVSEAP
jgi:hypothetical protein